MRCGWVEDLQLRKFGRLVARRLFGRLHDDRYSNKFKDCDEVRDVVEISSSCLRIPVMLVTDKVELGLKNKLTGFQGHETRGRALDCV